MRSTSTRPLAAVVLGILGGIVPVVGAKIILDACAAIFCDGVWLDDGWPLVIAAGVAIILSSSAMFFQPSRHVVWGTATLISSLLTSIWVLLLQLQPSGLIGLLLGAFGGGLGIAWRPQSRLRAPPDVQPTA